MKESILFQKKRSLRFTFWVLPFWHIGHLAKINSSCVPRSTISPLSNTKFVGMSNVDRRCAIIKVVRPSLTTLIAFDNLFRLGINIVAYSKLRFSSKHNRSGKGNQLAFWREVHPFSFDLVVRSCHFVSRCPATLIERLNVPVEWFIVKSWRSTVPCKEVWICSTIPICFGTLRLLSHACFCHQSRSLHLRWVIESYKFIIEDFPELIWLDKATVCPALTREFKCFITGTMYTEAHILKFDTSFRRMWRFRHFPRLAYSSIQTRGHPQPSIVGTR